MSVELLLHHYWRSSSSWRVRWGLALKGLSYRSNAIDLLKGDQDGDAFKRESPMGNVPCLVVDGRPLTESTAILEYLEELQPTPALLPSDRWLRARTRQLVQLINAGIQPIQNRRVLLHVSPEAEGQKGWARHWLVLGLQSLERELELLAGEGVRGPYAMGESVTMADLFLVPQLYNARRFHVDVAPYPRVVAVEHAALETDAAKGSHPDRFEPKK